MSVVSGWLRVLVEGERMVNWSGIAEGLRGAAPMLENHLWQTTSFGLAAWLLSRALRTNQARARYWIWLAASAKFLLPLAVLAGMASHFVKPRAVPQQQAKVYFAVEDVSEPFATLPVAVVDVTKTHISEARREAPVLVAGVVWLVGFVTVLAVWVVRWRRVARMMGAATTLHEGREFDALRRIEQAAGVTRPIELRLLAAAENGKTMEPGVFGLGVLRRRSVLAWPAGISERLDEAQLEAVLAHEVAHVRRRDNLAAAVHMFVEAMFWFHPLVWWVGARLVEERERACDEEVLALCGRPAVYAESILKVCQFCVETPLECVAGVTGADLKQRLVDIMTERVVRRMTVAKKLLLVAAAMVVVAVPVVLAQASVARGLMLAAMKVAPKPLRKVAHAMLALEETRETEEIAEAQMGAQPNVGVPFVQAGSSDVAGAPVFEVASIRPANPNERQGEAYVDSSGRFYGENTTVEQLVWFAYTPWGRQSTEQVTVNGPAWARTELFAVEAKLGEAEMAGWKTMSDRERAERVQPMVRRLLAERFHLTVRTEQRETQAYALVIAKSGLKLKEVAATPPPGDLSQTEWNQKTQDAMARKAPLMPGTFVLTPDRFAGASLGVATLVLEVTAQARLDAPLIDLTGLSGHYDFDMNWSLREGPPFVDEVERQLGLRVEPRKLPLTYYVIESAEKPSVDGAEVGADPTLSPKGDKDGAPAATVQVKAPDGDVPSIKFSVVYFKPTTSYGGLKVDLPLAGDYVAYHGVPIGRLIIFAYDHGGFWSTTGEPEWVNRDLYDFEAKVAAEDVAAWQAIPLNKKRLMVRALLGDALKLKVHQEYQPEPIYDLVVAKGGPKMAVWKEGDTVKDRNGSPVTGRVLFWYSNDAATCQSTKMADLAMSLSGQYRSGRTVIDKTGLTGLYNFTLPIAYRGSPQGDPDGMSVFEAVQTLGLKLVADKGQADKLVIDHIERPPVN